MNILDDETFIFLKALGRHEVKFILVGGLAVNYHGYTRTTGDVDVWLEESPQNRSKFVRALTDYGIPAAEYYFELPLIAGYSEILLNNGMYFDPMSNMKGFTQSDFQECYRTSESWQPEPGLDIKVLNINQLIWEKETLNRLKDQDDIEHLKLIRDRSKKD